MSLVGSLEDLSLGDILQIIGLSRKSGVLALRSGQGEGRIVFQAGSIRSVWVKEGPGDLAELLAARRALPERELAAACEEARLQRRPLDAVLVKRGCLAVAELDALRRQHIEAAVLRLFQWQSGEFSFEIRDPEPSEESPEMSLGSGGIQPQFLALEGARLADETGEEGALCDSPSAPPGTVDSGNPSRTEPEEPPAASEVAESASARPQPPVVIIDPELAVLEWAKSALGARFPRVHIFQSSELGLGRIRQYLARSEIPLVVLSEQAPADPVSGAQDHTDIARRLRAQAPQMSVFLLTEAEDDVPPGRPEAGDPARVRKPSAGRLSGRRGKAQREGLARRLAEALWERRA